MELIIPIYCIALYSIGIGWRIPASLGGVFFRIENPGFSGMVQGLFLIVFSIISYRLADSFYLNDY